MLQIGIGHKTQVEGQECSLEDLFEINERQRDRVLLESLRSAFDVVLLPH